MELTDIGFDGWFQEKWKELQKPDFSAARVTRVDRDRYLVRNEEREIPAEPTGKLLFSSESGQDLPCVGDWVLVQYHNDGDFAVIHDVLPRKSFLHRKTAGKKIDFQMIASNIDVAFIMQSCDINFNLRRMERYLVMTTEGRIEPVVLLSKSDLVDAARLDEMVSEIRRDHIDAKVISFSNKSETGLDAVLQALEKGKTYCLLGSSGVGKTTLLNRLLGWEAFETNPIREKDGRGRHTTTNRQMTVLDNGALMIDTPGMKELGMIDAGEGIDDSFSDIVELAALCRFNDCKHVTEDGCAVLAAVQTGQLDAGRHQNYLKLMKESEFHQMSYLERRKKDRQFGRMVNVALKQIKKK